MILQWEIPKISNEDEEITLKLSTKGDVIERVEKVFKSLMKNMENEHFPLYELLWTTILFSYRCRGN